MLLPNNTITTRTPRNSIPFQWFYLSSSQLPKDENIYIYTNSWIKVLLCVNVIQEMKQRKKKSGQIINLELIAFEGPTPTHMLSYLFNISTWSMLYLRKLFLFIRHSLVYIYMLIWYLDFLFYFFAHIQLMANWLYKCGKVLRSATYMRDSEVD